MAQLEADPPPGTSRPTVQTVAELAGVSVASVSRVLNGLPASEAMTRKVREAAAQLGYLPDAAARSLKAGRTEQLAYAVHDVGNPTYVTVMRAIESVTRAAGYRLLVSSTDADHAVEMSLLHSLSQRHVDGLVISPIRITDEHREALRNAPVPVVVVTGSTSEGLGVEVDTVTTDSRLGVELAVAHLAETGRNRIGFINGSADTVPGRMRLAGYHNGLANTGLPPHDLLVETAGEFTYAAGYQAARRLFERTRPDAVMCANDLIAVATMRAATEVGLRVPQDLAIVGVDDIELAAMVYPSLSSVSLGSAERGRIAARFLLERIKEPGLPHRQVRVAPRLVVRESSAPAGSEPKGIR
jgi:LacI family transcriptional regulator